MGYPGGPVIDKLAEKGNPKEFTFGLPHMTDGSLDFSFSGLKTAALKYIRELNISKNHPQFLDFLASFEMAIIRALLANLAQVIKRYKPKSLILCGGVARNKKLRKDFKIFAQEQGVSFFIPSPEFCTDNAAMVAALGLEMFKAGKKPLLALDLNAYPRFSSLRKLSK